ncbi:hypothetical protein [Paraburkholderia bryophila]|uniref:Uncharacterized protein n=1 Tax=Paraburkholderia bryophila TaxID=420952 RepID=A0A329CMB3_9BURK|nr:hypothetical protein [Paraburkholderia bryophila]RAS35859.1 hypothetical protein BX591_104189 [Paraburkholderia bryophila]
MANETTAPTMSLDVKEIVSQIDMAAGLFASAAQSFADLCAVFEAIRAAAPAGSLTARLAQLGINNCETGDSDFTEYSTDFSAYTESCSAALPNHSFRRLHSAEDSLQGGA